MVFVISNIQSLPTYPKRPNAYRQVTQANSPTFYQSVMHPPFYFILKINITLPLMGEGTNPTRTALAGFEADAVRGGWGTDKKEDASLSYRYLVIAQKCPMERFECGFGVSIADGVFRGSWGKGLDGQPPGACPRPRAQ